MGGNSGKRDGSRPRNSETQQRNSDIQQRNPEIQQEANANDATDVVQPTSDQNEQVRSTPRSTTKSPQALIWDVLCGCYGRHGPSDTCKAGALPSLYQGST